ncbi:MAG: TonB-dependent receptor family protein [Asticcacaulis sp.]
MAWAPCAAVAQSVQPETPEVIVTARRTSDQDVSRQRAQLIPGGANVVGQTAYRDKGQVILSRALSQTGGVIIQDFFGGHDQPRVQIRGSGLQQNPVERGILFLQDGLPLNRPDGSYIVGLADPAQSDFIEVFRGPAAQRLGATVLGGALNFVSPTGQSAPGLHLRAEAGSFGYAEAQFDFGANAGEQDVWLSGLSTKKDGYRTHNESQRTRFVANWGLKLSDTVQLRLFAGHAQNQFDVAGPLSLDDLTRAPQSVGRGPVLIAGAATKPGPNVIRDRPERDSTLSWIGQRTRLSAGQHRLDVSASALTVKDQFRFPVSTGIRRTDGDYINVLTRYSLLANQSDRLPFADVSLLYATGEADRRYFLNAAGQTGALFGQGELKSETLSVNLSGNFNLTETLIISPSLSYARATRTHSDQFKGPRPTLAFNPARPDIRLPDGAVPFASSSYKRHYDQLSPALALTWIPAPDHRLFVSLSHSFEPPSHDDLLATINGTPNSSAGRPTPPNPALTADVFRTPALKAQTGVTTELGWRADWGRVQTDVLIYTAAIQHELLNLRDETGVSLGAVNAGKTRHNGAEISLKAALSPTLTADLAYTWQDFHFVSDPVRGNRKLAGAPPHTVVGTLTYQATDALDLSARVVWRPKRTAVDNLNTLYAPPYSVTDITARYRLSPTLSIYATVNNLFDETYPASTLVVDAARPDQAVFIPAEGRSSLIGLRAQF